MSVTALACMVRVTAALGMMSAEEAEPAHTLTPPATSVLRTRRGPTACYVYLLGNLSPFILDLRRERDKSEPS